MCISCASSSSFSNPFVKTIHVLNKRLHILRASEQNRDTGKSEYKKRENIHKEHHMHCSGQMVTKALQMEWLQRRNSGKIKTFHEFSVIINLPKPNKKVTHNPN